MLAPAVTTPTAPATKLQWRSVMKKFAMLVIAALMVAMTSCAAIPPEAVQLSATLGSDDIQSQGCAYQHGLTSILTVLRSQAEKFAMNEYKQAFIDNVKAKMKQKDPNFIALTSEQYDAAINRI